MENAHFINYFLGFNKHQYISEISLSTHTSNKKKRKKKHMMKMFNSTDDLSLPEESSYRRSQRHRDRHPYRKQRLIAQNRQSQGSPCWFRHLSALFLRRGFLIGREPGDLVLVQERLHIDVVLDGYVESTYRDSGDWEMHPQRYFPVLLHYLL